VLEKSSAPLLAQGVHRVCKPAQHAPVRPREGLHQGAEPRGMPLWFTASLRVGDFTYTQRSRGSEDNLWQMTA
jgi:hypothetical protein